MSHNSNFTTLISYKKKRPPEDGLCVPSVCFFKCAYDENGLEEFVHFEEFSLKFAFDIFHATSFYGKHIV